MSICENCAKEKCFHRSSLNVGCSNYVIKTKTNADRIRAMSDEELAKMCVKQFPMYLWPNGIRTIYFDMENHNKDNAIKAWMQWLQQPAEGE